ncbi:MAG: methyltransferase domain-containing protein, partial [Magnetococcales bacterium]|nr:methyltransferase domain-containing protein [Magnetococcales bacterium]
LCASRNRLTPLRENRFAPPFEVVECADCHTLFRPGGEESPPHHLFDGRPLLQKLRCWKTPWRRFVNSCRMRQSLGRDHLLGRLMLHMFGPHPLAGWFRPGRVGQGARILQVGCGAGELLVELHLGGFTELTGVESRLQADCRLDEGLSLVKGEVTELAGPFDLIVLHHHLEYHVDPAALLARLPPRLATEGTVLLRMALAGAEAWRDLGGAGQPPRFLPTVRGLRQLAERTGFALTHADEEEGCFVLSKAEGR